MMAQAGASPRAPRRCSPGAPRLGVQGAAGADRGGRSRPAGCPPSSPPRSLELGIDMGAVDLVVQVESPPSVASGLQRVGRAGHQVGAVSRGVIFPKYRGDLVQAAVVAERMRAGAIEALRYPRNPLDVLAQQIVAMVRDGRRGTVDELLATGPPGRAVRRAAAVGARRGARHAGRPLPERRVRRAAAAARLGPGRRHAHRPARRAAARGHQRRHHPRPRAVRRLPRRRRAGSRRRVGELDEEMVYESRVGDVFTLGSTLLADRGHHPRPGAGLPGARAAGRLPFWKGDTLGPAGRARPGARRVRPRARPRCADEAGAGAAAGGRARRAGRADNLLAYLPSSARPPATCPTTAPSWSSGSATSSATGGSSSTRPFGAPGARAVGAGARRPAARAVRRRRPGDARRRRHRAAPARHRDDDDAARTSPSSSSLDPDDVEPLVTAEVGGSALFAARFRECAARALLLPRRDPGRRTPLWQQRQRAAQLLAVAPRVRVVPDRARDDPRVPAGRLRRARRWSS